MFEFPFQIRSKLIVPSLGVRKINPCVSSRRASMQVYSTGQFGRVLPEAVEIEPVAALEKRWYRCIALKLIRGHAMEQCNYGDTTVPCDRYFNPDPDAIKRPGCEQKDELVGRS